MMVSDRSDATGRVAPASPSSSCARAGADIASASALATLVPTERRSPREPELPPVIYAIPKPFTLWSPGRAFRLRNPIRRVHPPDRLVLQYQYVVALSRSEEHTSELQSRENLVCRLLL